MNKEIKLTPELFLLAKSGKKKATTRKGVKDFDVGEAYIINAQEPSEKLLVTIDKLEIKKYKEIDDSLAKLENYTSAIELKLALKTHYPTIKEEDNITIVYFSRK